MAEKNDMEKIVELMQEHVCDHLCRFPREVANQEAQERICAEREMGQFTCQILNQYNGIIAFDKAQCIKLLEKYAGIVTCDECEYQGYEKSTDIHYCRLGQGLEGILKPGSGCSKGKKRDSVN